MDEKEFKRFMEAQRAEIMKYKWLESEKAHCDIGRTRAAMEWTEDYAKEFREWWTKYRLK